jgi:hypothetical protein
VTREYTMQMNRQELVRSASRRMRRGKRTTGRIVVSTLGFGVAYYFDTENGELRRKRLHHMAQQAVRAISERLAPDATDPPAVFHPVLRPHHAGVADRPWERPAAAR